METGTLHISPQGPARIDYGLHRYPRSPETLPDDVGTGARILEPGALLIAFGLIRLNTPTACRHSPVTSGRQDSARQWTGRAR